MPVNDNPFVYPQTSAKPISTNYLRDEAGSVEVVEKDASGTQRVVATGGAIPVVFGKYQDNAGGVWVSPPAARVGLQLSDTENSKFSFGLVVSDGEIGPIDAADIYKGAFALNDLQNRSYTNAYGFMPEAGYNYSFSETTFTPGTPGTDDEIIRGTIQVPINQTNGANLGSSFNTVFTRSIDSSVNVTFTVTKLGSSDGMPFDWRILANNIVVVSGTGNGTASGSYDAGYSVGWRFEFKANNSSNKGQATIVMTGTGVRSTTTIVPGEPAIPPVYTTAGLPLYPGAGGNFIGLSCLAVRAEYEVEGAQKDIQEQVRCFVRNGIFVKNVATGATSSSSNFIDLAYYLLKTNQVSDELIDMQGFRDAREFLEVNGLRYNGAIASSTNIRSFFSAVAPGMMLRFVQDSGLFSFKPVLPVDGNGNIDSASITPVKVFTNQNIVQGSYRKSYYDTQLRKPFCVLLSWREQQRQVFSSMVSTEFRYNNTAIDGPFETYDYSDFITDINHASTVANYILSSRARTTHSISFSTYLDSEVPDERLAGQLAIMDVIRVGVTNNTAINDNNFYQVSSVTEAAGGQIDIEAIHFPSDDRGASLVAADVLASIPPVVPNPIPDGGQAPGPGPDPGPPAEGIGVLAISPNGYEYVAGMPITFTATYDGTATDVTFNWFGPPGTNAPVGVTTGPVLSWTSGGIEDNGGYTVIAISPTAPDSGKRATAGLDYQPFYKMSGGTVTTSGDFRIHTFKTNGQLTIDFAPLGGTFEYLIVGAGGQGSSQYSFGGGGGGGGGGVISGDRAEAVGSYPITVGMPGAEAVSKGPLNHSTAFGLTAFGGGDGSVQNVNAANGGSGGGGPAPVSLYSRYFVGTGVAGQGNNGGVGGFGRDSSENGLGGGGGATEVGGAGFASENRTYGGKGGEGLNSSISGTPYVYGSGGGGLGQGVFGVTAGVGGTGAGTGGRRYYSNGWEYQENTPSTNYGAGGSGGGSNNNGIQGIVIVRYQYK